ncbi:MAG TPA: hypothetical protein VHR27_02535, partial [Blastocatellia bacterium]|jgi:hypothetical protein|nr:hypothetical protein [Blastocatellia bacterium]
MVIVRASPVSIRAAAPLDYDHRFGHFGLQTDTPPIGISDKSGLPTVNLLIASSFRCVSYQF